MKSNLISLIGGAAVGLAVGCLISLKLCDRRHQMRIRRRQLSHYGRFLHHFLRHHTGGSFRELFNDNRAWCDDLCE